MSFFSFQMLKCIELDEKLKSMDQEITVNPQFVQKVRQCLTAANIEIFMIFFLLFGLVFFLHMHGWNPNKCFLVTVIVCVLCITARFTLFYSRCKDALNGRMK